MSSECRSNVFLEVDIYIPEGVRCCGQHLDRNGLIFRPLILALTSQNRPYVIPGADLQQLLGNLRREAQANDKLFNPNKLSEEEFMCLFSLNKVDFAYLLTFCDPVPHERGVRHISSKDLMTFLCKMRQGLSDKLLATLFNYSSRQAVTLAVGKVRTSLAMRFVPENIGTAAITREQFIARHVTPFANELYNNEPAVPKVIVVCDSTYAYIHKSSNFRILRQSYSLHKGRHLLKPTLLVAPDRYILAILGPYFSDTWNNDAEILRDAFERDAEILQE
ncbi:uncharacterized protein LOC111692151 [Anoplophora glabripennis]|uniref:uncharacterized protein LOC111692151 n=1 Tax=Anoplophora glabripennis TaxID=217634 RepID=UPI000C793DC2|nr:uncharacterized protein LOC111692151 [Anoplophora glabripennis]